MSVATATAATTATDTSALTAVTRKNNILGKDDFLKLLVAQLKHQDPQNPANADQMAAQLAQFSSVEQLTNISATLEKQSSAQATLLEQISAGAATSNIGRTITADSDLVELTEAGKETMLVTGTGGPATLNVYDPSTGQLRSSRSLGALASGTTEVSLGGALAGTPPGVWRVSVVSTDQAANPVAWSTAMRGVVTGVSTSATDGTTYAVGRLRIPLTAVTEVGSR